MDARKFLLGVAGAIGLLTLILYPMTGASDLALLTLSSVFMWVALASSWNLISGFTGYLDFGHVAFFGIGAYTAGYLMVRHEWLFALTLAPAFVVGSLFAFILGVALLRVQGLYFSIAMLGVFLSLQQASRLLTPITGGAYGLRLPPILNRPLFYYLFLAAAILVVWLIWWIRRSQLGICLLAIRENEVGAEARGINTVFLKRLAFALSAGITSTLGAIWAYEVTFLEPTLVYRTIFLITIAVATVLGGLGTVWGPVVGTAIYIPVRDFFWAYAGPEHTIFLGAGLIILVLFLPRGIVGFLQQQRQRFNIQFLTQSSPLLHR